MNIHSPLPLTRTLHRSLEEFVVGHLYKRIHTHKLENRLMYDMLHKPVFLNKNVVLMAVGTAYDDLYNETYVILLSEDSSGNSCEVVVRNNRNGRAMFEHFVT